MPLSLSSIRALVSLINEQFVTNSRDRLLTCSVTSRHTSTIQSSNRLSQSDFGIRLHRLRSLLLSAYLSAMSDRLVQIQNNDLANLKKLYTPNDSKGCSIAYMAIENYIRWLEQDPEEKRNIKFFCLNGDFSDGTFVVTVCNLFVWWTQNSFQSSKSYFFGETK